MKKFIPLFIIACMALSASACNDTSNSVNEGEVDAYDINDFNTAPDIETEGGGDNWNDEYVWYLKIIENYYNTPDTDILGSLDNVSDLFSMTLGEAIENLGPNHSEPYYYQLGLTINYPGSCEISTSDAISWDDTSYIAQMNPDAKIIGIEIIQQIDIYKGISVGKTLDEINSNPDLLNKIELSMLDGIYLTDGFGKFSAIGFYEYDGIAIEMYLSFNNAFICTNISLRPYEGNPIKCF